jgi:hypothetical protein
MAALLAAACGHGEGLAGGASTSVRPAITSTSTTTSTTTTSTTTSTTAAPTTTSAPATTGAPVPTAAPKPAAPKSTTVPPLPPPPTQRPAGGTPTSVGGCTLFPRSTYWYADVSTLPVHGSSAAYVNRIGAGAEVHPDFLAGLWQGAPIGVPYVVVPADQPLVPISFLYQGESDPGPYPIPADIPIEGNTDRHIIVVRAGDCLLHEVFDAHPDGNGGWTGGSGAVWNLNSAGMRPHQWTSADAAGMPILPGLVRYEEVAAGHIGHAIRMTVPQTQSAFVWPASHQSGSGGDPSLPPMGTWFRLRADFDTSGYPSQARVVLEALKTHGAIVADNGPAWKLSGTPDERWNNQDLLSLHNVKGADFEAVDTSSMASGTMSVRG